MNRYYEANHSCHGNALKLSWDSGQYLLRRMGANKVFSSNLRGWDILKIAIFCCRFLWVLQMTFWKFANDIWNLQDKLNVVFHQKECEFGGDVTMDLKWNKMWYFCQGGQGLYFLEGHTHWFQTGCSQIFKTRCRFEYIFTIFKTFLFLNDIILCWQKYKEEMYQLKLKCTSLTLY